MTAEGRHGFNIVQMIASMGQGLIGMILILRSMRNHAALSESAFKVEDMVIIFSLSIFFRKGLI